MTRVPAAVKKALTDLAEAVAPTCEATHFGGKCGAPACFKEGMGKKVCKFHAKLRKSLGYSIDPL